MKTTAILFRIRGEWVLSTYKGGTIPCVNFKTATEARAHAKSKKWNVRRAPDCDA